MPVPTVRCSIGPEARPTSCVSMLAESLASACFCIWSSNNIGKANDKLRGSPYLEEVSPTQKKNCIILLLGPGSSKLTTSQPGGYRSLNPTYATLSDVSNFDEITAYSRNAALNQHSVHIIFYYKETSIFFILLERR